jgi:hypothetical protein
MLNERKHSLVYSVCKLVITGAEGGNAPVSLPLPVATLIGLTITFKLEKASELVLSVAGPGLESCSGGGPFSMQVVAALWAQKVRRWHDYIVHSAAYAVFKQNKEATLQLLSLFPHLQHSLISCS